MDRNLFAEIGDSPEEIVAEARKALIVMLSFIALIWALQIANWADNYGLTQRFGIVPRDLGHLLDIFTAPFFHFSWTHIEANSGPLFIFGFLAAYRGVVRFFGVTLIVIVTSGLAVWVFESGHELTAGASGVIYGYFGYIIVKGLFDRRILDVLVGLTMALSFAYILVAVVPGTPGVSWIGHLGGLVGGIASGWVFRRRGPKVQAGPSKTPGDPFAIPGLGIDPTLPHPR